MWELEYKESWAPKNWRFWTVVLEKTLESPLDSKEIQPVHPNGSQSWMFIGRTNAEAETPTLWPPDVKSWLMWKDPDAERDWRREEKETTEYETVGWHHRLNGYEFEWTSGVGDGQGGLTCCSPWGLKETDWATELNWTRSTHEWVCHSGWANLIMPLPWWVLFDERVDTWPKLSQSETSAGIFFFNKIRSEFFCFSLVWNIGRDCRWNGNYIEKAKRVRPTQTRMRRKG